MHTKWEDKRKNRTHLSELHCSLSLAHLNECTNQQIRAASDMRDLCVCVCTYETIGKSSNQMLRKTSRRTGEMWNEQLFFYGRKIICWMRCEQKAVTVSRASGTGENHIWNDLDLLILCISTQPHHAMHLIDIEQIPMVEHAQTIGFCLFSHTHAHKHAVIVARMSKEMINW